jgi:predicted deacylase
MAIFEIKTIKCLTGVDLAEHNLPVMVLDSGKEGPVVWLFGALHGDEVNGVEVIHRIFKFFKRQPLKKGKIYALPIANPWGFELGRRENPFDLLDMNRQFPGDPEGSTSERIDYAIFKFITETKPTVFIDLHADYIGAIPHIIVDRVKKHAQEVGEKTWEFVNKFGLTSSEELEGYETEKSLSAVLINEAKIPAFTVELGGTKVISEPFVRAGVSGIKNILKYLDMIDYPKYWESETKIKTSKRLKLVEYVTCNESGIIKFLVRPGQKVKENKPLAKIKDVLGRTRDIVTAPVDCYVIACADTAVSFPGSFLFLLAAEAPKVPESKKAKVAETKTEEPPKEAPKDIKTEKESPK